MKLIKPSRANITASMTLAFTLSFLNFGFAEKDQRGAPGPVRAEHPAAQRAPAIRNEAHPVQQAVHNAPAVQTQNRIIRRM